MAAYQAKGKNTAVANQITLITHYYKSWPIFLQNWYESKRRCLYTRLTSAVYFYLVSISGWERYGGSSHFIISSLQFILILTFTVERQLSIKNGYVGIIITDNILFNAQKSWKRQPCSQIITRTAAMELKESLNTRKPPAAHPLQNKNIACGQFFSSCYSVLSPLPNWAQTWLFCTISDIICAF